MLVPYQLYNEKYVATNLGAHGDKVFQNYYPKLK